MKEEYRKALRDVYQSIPTSQEKEKFLLLENSSQAEKLAFILKNSNLFSKEQQLAFLMAAGMTRDDRVAITGQIVRTGLMAVLAKIFPFFFK